MSKRDRPIEGDVAAIIKGVTKNITNSRLIAGAEEATDTTRMKRLKKDMEVLEAAEVATIVKVENHTNKNNRWSISPRCRVKLKKLCSSKKVRI